MAKRKISGGPPSYCSGCFQLMLHSKPFVIADQTSDNNGRCPAYPGYAGYGLVAALIGFALSAASSFVAAQALPPCKPGQPVIDDRGNPGVIVDGRGDLCLIKYKGGMTQAWLSAKQLSAARPANSGAAAAGVSAPAPVTAAVAPAGSEGVVILRPPALDNRLVYHADALGHIVLTANVNGAPVRFLVDTGATLVSLTRDDADAAGLDRRELTFDQTVHTANGPVHAALARLREIRIDQLEVDNVPAAVIDSLKQSVLGMSFLSQLKSFEMRNGVLTMNW
jgi:aspartyl protease family protein